MIRKSRSGEACVVGSHLVKCYSKTQQIAALSSGEAEFYALVHGGAQGLGSQSFLRDLTVELGAVVEPRSGCSCSLGSPAKTCERKSACRPSFVA